MNMGSHVHFTHCIASRRLHYIPVAGDDGGERQADCQSLLAIRRNR